MDRDDIEDQYKNTEALLEPSVVRIFGVAAESGEAQILSKPTIEWSDLSSVIGPFLRLEFISQALNE